MRRFAPIIAGVAAGVLALLLVFLLVLPKRAQVAEVEEQIVAAEQQTAALQLQLQQLQAMQERAPQTRRQLNRIQTLIPPTADLPGLIRLLKSAAERSGVDFFTISPSTPTPETGGEFSVISTGVTLNGTFFSMEEFLYRLETLPRAAKVTTLSLQPRGEGGTTGAGEMTMSITVELYTTDLNAGPGSTPGPTEQPAAGG